MDKFFISPPEAPSSGWALKEGKLAEALRTRWPDAELEVVSRPESLYVLCWTVNIDGEPIDGSLARNRLTVVLDGDVRAAAVFARWLRDIVPASQPLLFYDEGYSADIRITANTSPEDLAGLAFDSLCRALQRRACSAPLRCVKPASEMAPPCLFQVGADAMA